MRTRRIFISPEELLNDRILFSEKTSQYLRKVLRLGPGDQVEVLHGDRQFLVQLIACSHGTVEATVVEVRQAEDATSHELTLAFCCVRPGPLGEILRHGTELGVCRFIPILSARSARRPEEKKTRWESVVKSAAQQSGRMRCPVVEAPLLLEDLLTRADLAEVRFVLSVHTEAQPFMELIEETCPARALVLLGPEGGFDASEEARIVAARFKPVSLGPRVLRTETAALAASTILMLWHDRVRGCENEVQQPAGKP